MKIGVCKRYGKKREQFLPYALPLIEQEEIDEVIGTLKSGCQPDQKSDSLKKSFGS